VNKGAIIGISAGATAAAVIVIVALLLAPRLNFGDGRVPYDTNFSRPISAGNWDYLGVTLEDGEGWVVDYTSTTSVNAYLLTEAQFQYFYNYGTVPTYLSYKSGMSGHFDYTATSSGNYMVLFRAGSSTTVSGTTTEYHWP